MSAGNPLTNTFLILPFMQFCWGSKVISLAASTPENPFKIAAECHPAMVDPKDAEK